MLSLYFANIVNQGRKACKYFHSPAKPASLKLPHSDVSLQNKRGNKQIFGKQDLHSKKITFPKKGKCCR